MIVVLTGKSCSGKDSVRNVLVDKYGYENVISYTTRPMRRGEIQGKEYWFVSKEEMDKIDVIDYREYKVKCGEVWGYGHTIFKADKNKNYVAIVDLEGAKEFRKIYKNQCKIVYIDSNKIYRTKRASKRGDDLEEWLRRLKADDIDFSDIKINSLVDYKIINEDRDITDLAYEIDKYIRG